MTLLSKIKHPVQEELNQFEALFNEILFSRNILLNDVLSYILQRRGKMMRPVLVFLIGKLFGTVTSKTIHTALALELLHTASLIHDDIVDESDERRGQPSVNTAYNNKLSVLVGDYLLANCLMQASMTFDHHIIQEISLLGKDLSEGEVLQLSTVSEKEVGEDTYFSIIRMKTAALFAACSKIAALSVSATPEETEIARQFGENLGICFQIKDDIFDYFDNSKLGKPTGNDMHEGKLTLPVIYALHHYSTEKAQELASKVKNYTATEEDILHLIEFAKNNGGIEYATSQMYFYKEKAAQFLSGFPDTPVKNSLLLYLELIVKREN